MFFRSTAGLAIAVVGTAIGAQSPLRTASPRDTLTPAVITATRVAITTVAPTSTTTILSGDALRAQGITRVQDALRLVPGATLVSGGPIGSQTALFLRGGNSNYVRVLVDGVPVNDAGGSVDLANFTTDNIDRIEVVRGPGSVLYGSDAVTGVIQIFTHDGSGPLAFRAGAENGTAQSRHATASLSGGTARAGGSLSAARHSTDGILPFNNRYVNDVLSGSVRIAPDTMTDARLAARWSAGTYQYPTDFDGTVNDRNAEQSDHRLTLSVDAGRRITDRLGLRVTLASHEFLPRSNDGPDTAGDTVGFFGFYSRSVRTHRSADLRVNARVGGHTTVTVGAEVARDRERSSSLSLSAYGPNAGGFEASRHNTGWYAQAMGDATTRVSFAVGTRLDANSAFGRFMTERASVAYAPNRLIRARAAVGTAFKAPSFFENFATGYVTGNAALKPERSQSAELGLDLTTAGGAAAIKLTGYVQRFRDVIQYSATTPSPGAPNYFNVAGANANGLELEASWRLSAQTTVATGYSWTDTRVTATGFDTSASASYVKGERLIRRPPHTISASVARAFAKDGSVQLVARRVGERSDRDFSAYPAAAVILPAHTKVDLSFNVPVRGHGLSLTGRIDNLFAARYDEVARFRAPGTIAVIGVHYQH